MHPFIKHFFIYSLAVNSIIVSAVMAKLFLNPFEARYAEAVTQKHAIGLQTQAFMAQLRTQSLEPVAADRISRRPFSVPGRMIAFNGGNIQIFEYADNKSALEEASKFADSYKHFLPSKTRPWERSPYIRVNDKLIILYMGHQASIIGALEANAVSATPNTYTVTSS